MTIYITKIFATVLQALEQKREAYMVLEFIRDICEDTSNFMPLLDVYYRMGILLKKMAEYDKALIVTKKMLQLSWVLKSEEYEIKAYKIVKSCRILALHLPGSIPI